MERRLSAILAADMVGYSRLMEADEVGTIKRQNAHRREFIDLAFKRYHGRIIKEMGDGILVEFPSVVEAVSCAVDIQRAMPVREADVPESRRISYRFGINLGDVVVKGEDIFGDGVNVAARLEQLSKPGGICISGTAYDHIEGRTEFKCSFLGEQKLKNISRPIRAYSVAVTAGPQKAMDEKEKPSGGASLTLPDKPSIAVLPFENMSGDPEQEYFSDGISEDIITELSRFRSLFVIARNSSFTYKGQATDVQRIAAELGVRYVLEGSIRKAGSRIRVTAQLIDALSRNHVWAEKYDRDLEDIFVVQDEITQTIVAAIEPELGGAERDRAHRAAPDNLDAWGLYQRGLWHIYRFTAADTAEARSLFELSTKADPSFAPAWAGLSFAHFSNAFLGYQGDRDLQAEKSLQTARRSVELDDRDASAHWALGRAYLICADYDRAIAELETAIKLNPNYAQAHYALGWALVADGRHEEAVPHVDHAERLSPHDPLLFAFCAVRSQAFFNMGDLDRSLAEASRSSRQANTHTNTRILLVAILGKLGRVKEARSELAAVLADRPGYTRDDFMASYRYRRPEDTEGFLAGLTAAGVP